MVYPERRKRAWGSFPTTADVGIRASGGSPSELFEGLGLGLFALMTDLRTVRARETRSVHVSAGDPEGLVVAYLTRLIQVESDDGFVARDIRVRLSGSPPTSIDATLRGEPFDLERHPRRTEVKAVTLHRLTIDLVRGRARVIVDI
jgi:SHS2 domain-containing protein